MMTLDSWCDGNSWQIERRADGIYLVRVHSKGYQGQVLPDAVFTFRPGDPQYSFWEAKYQQQNHRKAAPR